MFGGMTGLFFPLIVSSRMLPAIEVPIADKPPFREPEPTLCGSCGSTMNEHGELPCGH
jgi:hypothetical protein